MADRQPEARALAKLLGVFHNISYYAPEMKAFSEVGLPEYWRAYMAYRSAPMGLVSPSVVTATFYNFAPRVVAEALPSAWEGITPQAALELRDSCIDIALRRALGPMVDDPALMQAADLALQGIADVDISARPLFGAHAELEVPNEPHRRLWHACTLWREHRGDGHNLALAAAGIDGIECHVLLAAKGVGDRSIIEKIRGWTDPEWDAAQARLVDRGLLDTNGEYLDAGRTLRADIEEHTDQLAAAPRLALGSEQSATLIALMEPLVGQLITSGSVPGRWPPPSDPGGTQAST